MRDFGAVVWIAVDHDRRRRRVRGCRRIRHHRRVADRNRRQHDRAGQRTRGVFAAIADTHANRHIRVVVRGRIERDGRECRIDARYATGGTPHAGSAVERGDAARRQGTAGRIRERELCGDGFERIVIRNRDRIECSGRIFGVGAGLIQIRRTRLCIYRGHVERDQAGHRCGQ